MQSASFICPPGQNVHIRDAWKWPNREELFTESYAQWLAIFENKSIAPHRARFSSEKCDLPVQP
jgi:hypothetical protein